MPTYSILRAPGMPPVGGAYNARLLQDILRRREGFQGLVVSDWEVTQDCSGACQEGRRPGELPKSLEMGKPWGMESSSHAERIVAAILAGVDQIGGEDDSAPIVEAAKSGRLPMWSPGAPSRRGDCRSSCRHRWPPSRLRSLTSRTILRNRSTQSASA